ncbi:hypothetical protein RFN57_25785 [Streptomyces violaceochromogenes]|uniref:Uncharacterized protein n=1 Tax=Streptomyces violaceochromogenes TaxID=67377 RepID=A0ABU6M2E7_9ACTN|nr:hypothetical protein [Streptomyces violaceochromogenes]MEC7055666.1 hypothetical protein [Streptomyces violaceochromogenes]GHC74398.1 hypothetical protein GCM10010309_45300 [Streptomyces violaceochromogenes]
MSERIPTPAASSPASPYANQPASLADRQANERADLATFAEGLAARLPGSWTAVAQEHAACAGQSPLAERLWDDGHVQWAFGRFVLSRHAVLTSGTGCELVVVYRPRRTREFLVAALEPLGSDVADRGKAPNGIVVDADPARAAPAVAGRLLPRYEQAVRAARVEQGAVAVAAGERVLAEWDAIADSLCDADHWPLDERYDLRQQQRDGEMWALFAPFLDHGPALVAHAEEMLPFLDPQDRAEGRWPYRLRVLREALEGGARVQADFEFVTGALLPDHPRAGAAFARALVERNTEGWHYSLTWMESGGVLVDMARAERGRPVKSQQSAQVQAARARSSHTVGQGVTTTAVSATAAPPGVLAPDRASADSPAPPNPSSGHILILRMAPTSARCSSSWRKYVRTSPSPTTPGTASWPRCRTTTTSPITYCSGSASSGCPAAACTP